MVIYGVGVIIEQAVNKIKEKYSDCEKTYFINRKYINCPAFKDDKETVDDFTDYDEIVAQIKNLKAQLSRIS